MSFTKIGNKKLGERSMVLSSKYKIIVFNLIGGLSIFFILVVLRFPILANSDQLLSSDEAIFAYQILDLYNGGPIFFYYDVVKYFGIFNGLIAIPFFWILEVGALAFKLPATLFYALYILSTYWLVKKIQPRAAWVVILLMIFPSPAIWWTTAHNGGVSLICFLGNLIFLSFLKVKEIGASKASYVFLLGFLVGFAIYTFTYSIVYIGSTIILFVLSSSYFLNARAKYSKKNIVSWFVRQKGVLRKFVGILDVFILFFIFTTCFSYIFGGFGIDIAGYSVLQSNALHKPLAQLLVLVVFRVCLLRQDVVIKLNSIKLMFISVDPLVRRSVLIGLLGFAVGIFPRVLSILTGETTRGGQGFDVDFIPTNLVYHFWQLMTRQIPEVLGLWAPIVHLLDYEMKFFYILNGFLVVMVMLLISRSIISFVKPRWQEVKDIVRLKALVFNPAQFFLILPIVLCVAVVISQSSPTPRYLFPLHGVVSICAAIYFEKIRHEFKMFFAFALVVWCMFSGVGIYQTYVTHGIVRDFSIVEKPNRYSKIIEFCKEHEILHAYSGYGISAIGSFLSRGDLQIAEYTKDVWGWKIKERLAREDDFAIIVDGRNSSHLETYQKYLDGNLHSYSRNIVKGENSADDLYYIFSNFQGEAEIIDRLRSLIVG